MEERVSEAAGEGSNPERSGSDSHPRRGQRSGRAGRPRRSRPQRSTKQALGSIVLGFEVIVVFLATLVAFGLGALEPFPSLAGGGAIIVLMLATLGLLRFPWGFALGWVTVGIVVATGFVLPAMFAIGGFFAALWAYGMFQGARIDREKAAAQSAWESAATEEETS